ncbi:MULTISPECIES: DUF3783 domain-containing protein [Thermosipho]|uniref:DUF3783 domain-containing protein n=1 Tax=Thermosipho affectus TaxID=660294 RepID=A0ABX3IJF6_9BACT|nr:MULTISPECIES: DUF3783 domain-containing protein [Thermosipho]ANQ53090.1 hypothetical protein Y592_00880 [Thermosipho sp. 1070]APT71539.1 hypothetical protein BG95_00875 [Thermosipho sp. 1063]MBT1248420.1 hypothetical protein [Thermosipho sp. 1244]ONN27959.1 hypothetical protein XJ44_00865 [Thermosipho affectus]OOC45616.1 hypothetical protein XO08_00880 [Thermosipho sp. 1074]
MEDKRFVILHGFEKDDIFKVMKILKENFPEKELIFATTTPTNLNWKLSDLIVEIEKEHKVMKKMRK